MRRLSRFPGYASGEPGPGSGYILEKNPMASTVGASLPARRQAPREVIHLAVLPHPSRRSTPEESWHADSAARRGRRVDGRWRATSRRRPIDGVVEVTGWSGS